MSDREGEKLNGETVKSGRKCSPSPCHGKEKTIVLSLKLFWPRNGRVTFVAQNQSYEISGKEMEGGK